MEKHKSDDMYISLIENFIGKEWVQEELTKYNKRNILSNQLYLSENLHPFVALRKEIEYKLTRAKIEKKEKEYVLMGRYWHILDNAGKLLKFNYEIIPDLEDFRARLRNTKQFDDVIWELEVITMLRLLGLPASLRIPDECDTLSNKKGLYMFKIHDEIVYIGCCCDNFKYRISNGYVH